VSVDASRMLVENFLGSSWSCCIRIIVEKLASWNVQSASPFVSLFKFKDDKRVDFCFKGSSFFLRSSVEYSNPQLTVEEVQGIIAARLLEVCGNYFNEFGLCEPGPLVVLEICERLRKPPEGPIVAFLLNTDDIEPDRYSMNPLKQSILDSGQSAFPAANVKASSLKIDKQFVAKYEGTLISKDEAELITTHLASTNDSYLDFSDAVKYAQLDKLSEVFGIDLALPALRMPLTTLGSETKDGLLHRIISETHRDFETIKKAYDCMGRSIAKRSTLMTVPHSKLGYGSKRAARGKLRFNKNNIESVSVTYKTTPLYPNAMDPEDVSIAQAEDSFSVSGEKLSGYAYAETPSSPQFFLYALGSPENAALWHGVGAFASPQLLQSYSSIRSACREAGMFRPLRYLGLRPEVPMQFNLSPDSMWVHPVHRNIDASIGCVENVEDLARMGMKIEYLPKFG